MTDREPAAGRGAAAGPPRPGRGTRVAAWAGLVVLLALHLDAWRPQRAVVYAGWIPEELLYRLAWMAGAFVYLLWFCAAVWRDGDGRHGRHDSHGRHGGRTR